MLARRTINETWIFPKNIKYLENPDWPGVEHVKTVTVTLTVTVNLTVTVTLAVAVTLPVTLIVTVTLTATVTFLFRLKH